MESCSIQSHKPNCTVIDNLYLGLDFRTGQEHWTNQRVLNQSFEAKAAKVSDREDS